MPIDGSHVGFLVVHLAKVGVTLDRGMTPDELTAVEDRFGFVFPPDLSLLLQRVVPVSHGFPDWRDQRNEDLPFMLALPVDGVLFDVQNGVYWHGEWGEKPSSEHEALAVARERLSAVPQLIPFHSHRYVSSEPAEAGNPVFSVVQTDVVVYGNDLAGNLALDFGIPLPGWARTAPRRIRFWSDVVDWNNTPL